MTFRAKPVANKPRRQSRDSTAGGTPTSTSASASRSSPRCVILVGVAGFSYYGTHLAAAATVGGQTITKDDFKDAAAIEVWRLQQQQARIQAAVAAGRLTSSQGQTQIQSLQQQAQTQTLAPQVLEQLIDGRIQADLAKEAGVSVTPDQIDAKIAEEATTPEQRHAWIIEVAPEVERGRDRPDRRAEGGGEEERRPGARGPQPAARTGRTSPRRSRPMSTARGRRRPRLDRQGRGRGPQWLDAVFAADAEQPTEVIEGDDGVYRIGRVTDIGRGPGRRSLAREDQGRGLDLAKYRAAVASDVIRPSSTTRSSPTRRRGPQRQVLEIYIQEPGDAAAPGRGQGPPHPVLAERRSAARPQDLPANDPAWATAQPRPTDGLRRPGQGPLELFDADRPRPRATRRPPRATTGTGGKLPYFDSSDATSSRSSRTAILTPGLKAGDILEPFKSAFGWHVVQVMYHPPDQDADGGAQDQGRRRRRLRDARPRLLRRHRGRQGRRHRLGRQGPARRPADSARSSRRPSARRPRSSTSTSDGDVPVQGPRGARRGRPTAASSTTIKSDAFSNWYDAKKAAVTITRDRCSPSSGSADRRPVLDALVAEARLRWGLDPAAGLQVVARAPVATPLEPSRPAADRARWRRSARARPTAAAVEPLPGPARARRRRPAGAPAPALPGRPSGRAVRAGRRDDGRRARPRRRSRRRSTSAPVAPELAVAGPVGDALDLAPACASPTAARGTASRPTRRCATTCSRRRTRSTTRSRRGATPALAGSSATCCSRSCSTPSSPPRRASST